MVSPQVLATGPSHLLRGTPLEAAFERGEYTPPELADVAQAVLHARDKGISVFVGLNDEGLAVEGGSFNRAGDEALINALESFNRTQDYAALDAFCADQSVD